MRVSVRENDAGYVNYRLGQRSFLNGEEVTFKCFTADEERGEVHVFKLNERGVPYYDPREDEIPWEILRGEVRIVLNEFVPSIEMGNHGR